MLSINAKSVIRTAVNIHLIKLIVLVKIMNALYTHAWQINIIIMANALAVKRIAKNVIVNIVLNANLNLYWLIAIANVLKVQYYETISVINVK